MSLQLPTYNYKLPANLTFCRLLWNPFLKNNLSFLCTRKVERLQEIDELIMKKFKGFNSNELKNIGRELEVVEYNHRPMTCLKNRALTQDLVKLVIIENTKDVYQNFSTSTFCSKILFLVTKSSNFDLGLKKALAKIPGFF